MSFKLLEIGRSALRRACIGRSALVAAAVCVATAPTPSFAQTIDGDHTISADTKLTEDVTVNGALTLSGAAIDLNGHTLTVKGVTGQGVITDTLNDQYALYQELTYLESTTAGKQFIDTGYIHSTRSNVHIKFRHPSYPKNYTWFSYFGGGGRDAKYSFGGWIVYTSGKYYHWKSLGTSEGTWAGSSANTDYHLFIRKSSAAGDSGHCYVANASNSGVVAGVVTASATEWPTDVTPVTAYLFGHHNLNGTLNSAYVGSRIYLCEIKDGGTDAANLVRNFIPMKRRADDKPGMMDKVNDVFYTNANPDSTADFTAGPATATTLTATAAEIAAAGTLVLDIDEGDSVNLSSLKLYGKVKLVKTGKGTLVQDVSADWVCGIEVQDGQFQTTDALAASIKTDLSIKAGATVSIACTGAASAVMPAAVSLEAGAKLLFDTTAFSGAGLEFTVGGITFGEGATASECIATANPLYGVTLESATLIRLDRLTAPITAVWTGNGTAGNFDDPGNWNCYNKIGGLLDNTTLPSADTVLFRLDADADWTAKGAIALGAGVTLDLNGNNLAAASITGAGVVIDTTAADIIVADDGSMYQKILYVQATQEGASNSAQNKIQYVDTGYYHIGTTKVDIRVEFQDVSYSGNYGYAVYYGCRDQNNYKTAQLGGWFHNGKFYYYDTSEHDGSTAYTGRIYDIRLDKNGSSYANYADGTRASTLGTGNGVGDSNTYGTDYIFANNQVPNGGKYWPCKCRVYSCKVYEGNEPKRDFVPVRCISGEKAGEAGFWCNVTEKFYGNSGYGVLTAGPVKKSATAATGSVTITVGENDTLPLASISPIHGNVKVVKMGAGTLAVPTTGVYFTGGIDVQAGALSFAGPVTSVEGLNLGNVMVASGAKAMLPATDGLTYGEAFTLNGGTLEFVCSGTAEPVTTYVTDSVTLNAGAKIRFDTTTLQATQFLLSTDGFTLGEGVESAVSCAELSAPTETVAEASGANGILVTVVTAPVTAVWTGAANNNDFNDSGNWSCTNVVGGALVDTLPDSHTANYVLAVDADWSAATVTIPEGATLNMNGHRLKVTGLAGTGTITDAASGYLALEYLEGTGTQYIKTGYTMNSSSTADFKAYFTGQPSGHWHGVFGQRSSGGDAAGACLFLYNTNNKTTFWKTLNGDANTSLVPVMNTDYTFHISKTGTASTVTGGSFVNAVLGTATTTTCSGDAYIFNLRQGGGVWDGGRCAHMRLYYLTFSENGTPVHDFVPARRLPDGVLGLYDKNNGAFLVNSGSGAFTGGNVKSELALNPVAGGELEVYAPEGQTVTINTVNITGSVKLVKTGLGTLVMAKAQNYLNGTEVEAGTIKPSAANLATPYGAVGSKISATANGTVDFNGNANMNKYVYEFADGAKALNGGAAISSGVFTFTSFYTPVTTGAFTASLADGATLDLTEWNGAWPIANVTAPAGATVMVKVDMDAEGFRTLAMSKDAETGKNNGKLLSFGGARPADTTFVPDAVSANRCRFIEGENGDIILAFRKGFMIIIK